MRFAKLKIKPPPVNIPLVVYISMASILGTCTGLVVSRSFSFDYVLGSSLAISVSIIGLCIHKKKHKVILFIVATFGIFFSRAFYVTQSVSPPWLVVNNGDLVELQGSVVTTPIITPRTEGYLSPIDDRPPVTTFNMLGSPARGCREQHLFKVEVDGAPKVNKGYRIITIGRIRRHLHTNTIPTLFVSQETLVKIIHKNIKVGFETEQIIKQKIMNGLEGEEKTLVSALFFGERGVGWRELATTFRRAGLSHILAVSGLHTAIIMLLIICVIRSVSVGKYIYFIVICAVSIFLLSIIESRPPVFRAIFMIIVASTLQLRGQRFSGSGILALVAMVVAWVEPTSITTVGFILSFTVVLGLCALLPTLQWKLLGPRDNYAPILETMRYTLSSLWIVGLCAVLVATPLIMYKFGTFAPIGLLSGLGGMLFLFLILLLGIVRLTVGWIHPLVDEQLLCCMKIFVSQMLETTKQYGEIPLFFHINPPGVFFVIFLFLFLYFVIMTRRWLKTKIIINILLTIYFFGGVQDDHTVISTLNVGHGTSHIIQDGKTTILVDAGSRVDLDIGFHKVLPSLRKRGITTINTLIVTHNDLDHCSAILDLMQKIKIQEICMTPHALANQTQVVCKIVQVAKSKQIIVNKITAGWSVDTSNTTITALWPKKNTDYTSSNEASVVLSIQSAGRSVLLTGDINEKTISKLLSQTMEPVDVLEMPHHGQWSNESVSLLQKLRPKVVVQSTSKSRYAHDEWVIPRNTNRLVTCIDGDIITTITNGGVVEIETTYTNLSLVLQ